MLNALKGTNPITPITHLSAHTADPGDSGINEVVGGSYARQAITFNAAAGGAIDSSNQPAVPIPAATTVTHLGFWSALSAGSFLGGKILSAPETFGSAGTLNLTDADLDLNA